MEKVARDLKLIIEKYYPVFKDMPSGIQTAKPLAGSWTKKQELGHLVDSAHNNLQRFVRVQYQESVKISYNPDEWVRINDYQKMPWNELVDLWSVLNKQIARILSALPVDFQDKALDIGAQEPNIHPLSFVAEDYVVHMQHHLDHIFAGQAGTA